MKNIFKIGKYLGLALISGGIIFGLLLRDSSVAAIIIPCSIIGSILLFGSLIMSTLGFGNSKILKEGILTVGILKSLRQTGAYLNKNPQVEMVIEIRLEDGSEIQGTTKQFIPLVQISALTIEMKLPVRYLKEAPEKLVIDTQTNPEELQKAYNDILIQKGELDPALLEISENGLKGKGIIMESRPTGKLINNKIEMQLRIAVTGDNGDTFEVETTRGILQQMVPHLQVAGLVKIAYLARDHSKFTIITPLG